MDAAKKWLDTEPFSDGAASLGTSIASIVGDAKIMLDFAEQGARANPNSVLCVNNRAFAEAVSGKLDAAEKTLGRLRTSALTPIEQAIVTATRGIILMRGAGAR
jgi:hypothetical protein